MAFCCLKEQQHNAWLIEVNNIHCQLPAPVTASLQLGKAGKLTDFSTINPHEM
jgi:hypothetical protein